MGLRKLGWFSCGLLLEKSVISDLLSRCSKNVADDFNTGSNIKGYELIGRHLGDSKPKVKKGKSKNVKEPTYLPEMI